MEDRELVNRVFGERLKDHRLAAAITRWQVAAKSGLSPDTIGRYERGEGGPSIRDAMRIAEALDVRIEQLLPEQEDTA